MHKLKLCCLYSLISKNFYHKICIIGSGPAAFYVSQYLAKRDTSLELDMYEKLPFPFGLVRYGVAPDHQSAKNVIHKFDLFMHTGANKFSFFGNIAIGKDLSLQNLLMAYNAIVLCYGAFNAQSLNIPGENLNGVYSAQEFVGWYNGHPQFSKFEPILHNPTLVIGVGNVSLDIARILLSPMEFLESTDIKEYAIDKLSKYRPTHVIITGRRGPLDATFTIKEFRKITSIPNCTLKLDPLDFRNDDKFNDPNMPRPKLRIKELFLRELDKSQSSASQMGNESNNPKTLEFKFYHQPVSIYPSSDNDSKVGGVTFKRTKPSDNTPSNVNVNCGTILKSIGYKGKDIDPNIPLIDPSSGIIPNDKGMINKHPGLFCAGWIKTGSTGDITTAMYDAHQTAETVLNYLKTLDIQPSDTSNSESKLGKEAILAILKAKGIKYTTILDWKKIDQLEVSMGQAKNKLREKLIDMPDFKE